MSNKLTKIANFNIALNPVIGTDFSDFPIFRSKGLLTHLISRNHYNAAQYIKDLPAIINQPDYAGYYNGNIELVKIDKINLYICIKLDKNENRHYVATMFDIKKGKLESYIASGRLKRV